MCTRRAQGTCWELQKNNLKCVHCVQMVFLTSASKHSIIFGHYVQMLFRQLNSITMVHTQGRYHDYYMTWLNHDIPYNTEFSIVYIFYSLKYNSFKKPKPHIIFFYICDSFDMYSMNREHEQHIPCQQVSHEKVYNVYRWYS